MTGDAFPLDRILDRMEELYEAVEAMPRADRDLVVELLDRVDDLHRLALTRLGQALSPAEVERLRAEHPAIAWLWEAYSVGVGPRIQAERALDAVRPYLDSHGGTVEVIDVDQGRVTVALGGSCSGCTASAITLQEGVEEALRTGYPDFAELLVHEDENAIAHPPPGATLLQVQWHPDAKSDG